MSNPFIGEIRMFGGSFAPAGWAFCDGQLLPISENDALFVLIGTTYGGDGQETFALPNLQSRFPVHMGQGPGTSGRIIGEATGTESVTLTLQQIPLHSHPPGGTQTDGNEQSPAGRVWAGSTARQFATNPQPASMFGMAANSLTPTGGSQPHENMSPYLCISFIISLFGIFPTQT